MILEDIKLAFQNGVPAWRFSLKVKKQRNTNSGAHKIGVPAGGFSARKKSDYGHGFQANRFSGAGSIFIEKNEQDPGESHTTWLGGANNNFY